MSEHGDSIRHSMTDKELAVLRAKLDLPDQVIEFLRHQPLPGGNTVLAGMTVFSASFAILSVLPLAGIFLLDFGGFLVSAGFLPRDAIMFDLDLKSATLGAIFLWVMGALFLSIYLIHLCIRWNTSSYYKGIAFILFPQDYRYRKRSQNQGRLLLPFTKRLLHGLNRNLPPQEYLTRFERRLAAVWARPALICYFGAFALFGLGFTSMMQVTPEGIAMSSYFGSRNLNYEWKDIVSIRTSCSTVRRRRKLNHTVGYYLQFDDNRIVDLGSFWPLSTTWLDALNIVDGKLAALGVPKTEEKLDQSCLDAERLRLGPRNYERLGKILKIKVRESGVSNG